MPSKQLVDLVNRLKNSGIKISFTVPRSKISLNLQETTEFPNDCVENGLQKEPKKKGKPTLHFI